MNPDGAGTKAAAWYELAIPGGGEVSVRLRLTAEAGAGAPRAAPFGPTFEAVLSRRIEEADAFYAAHRDAPLAAEERRIVRQADAGLRLVEAVLRLRRGAVARRRSGAAAAARRPSRRAEPRLDAPVRARRPLGPRHLGVPLVRGLGPRLPVRRDGARRSVLREAPAAPALPRVVHAPERTAPRVRVRLRGRQPARARLGRVARLSARRSSAASGRTGSSWRASSRSAW